MTDETHIAVGELVQAAAHQHGVVGPVPFTVSRPKYYEWGGLEDDYEEAAIKSMTKEELMIAAKEFLADHDYLDHYENLTHELPIGVFEVATLIERFAQFAYEMIEKEEDRILCNERLLAQKLSAAAFKGRLLDDQGHGLLDRFPMAASMTTRSIMFTKGLRSPENARLCWRDNV